MADPETNLDAEVGRVRAELQRRIDAALETVAEARALLAKLDHDERLRKAAHLQNKSSSS